MKKLLVAAFVVMVAFTACNNVKKAKTGEDKAKAETSIIAKAQSLDNLMKNAEQNVGKEVFVKGLVDHVCEHSGRRCFLVNDDEKLSIRVEAGGEIKGFNKELSGSIIAVKGKLQIQKITAENINEFEEKVKAQKDTEEGGKHCDAQMANIQKMRTWMKEHGKNYYPKYFVEGIEYEIVE